MDAETVVDATASIDDINPGDPEAEVNNMDLHEGISSNGEVMLELGNPAVVLKRVELDFACSSEKLNNLRILTMHVATRESDFEAFAFEEEHTSGDSVQKALEFDLLTGILDSEATELDNFIATLQKDVVRTHEILSSCEILGGDLMEIEEKLHDSEVLLKQSQEHVSEIRMQSAKFHRTLQVFGREGKCKLSFCITRTFLEGVGLKFFLLLDWQEADMVVQHPCIVVPNSIWEPLMCFHHVR